MDRRKRAIDAYRKVVAKPEPDPADPSVPLSASSTPPATDAESPDDAATERESGIAHKSSATSEPVSGFLKTDAKLPPGAGPRRSAALLLTLPPAKATDVLRHLDEAEVEAIMRAMIELGSVRGDELTNLIKTGDRAGVIPEKELAGGPDVAREMLAAAFGPEAGERIFFRAVPNAPAHHFAFVNDLEPVQLRNVLRDEAPAAVALILAHVDRPLAAAVMNELEPEVRADVARRIARLGELSRDVVVRVEEALREKVRRQASDVSERVEGTEKLAAILRHMNPSEGDSILHDLREESVDLESAIRSQLFTIDLIRAMAPRHLADLLRDLDNATIALFLRGKDEELRALVLRSLSDRRAELVSDEYAHMGPQPRDKVDEATQMVLERMRELEADGTILVPREGDRYI